MFVDNLGAICDNVALSQKNGIRMDRHLRTPWFLALHKTEEQMGLGDALGTALDGRDFASRVTSKRFWTVRQGLIVLLRRGRCIG